MPLPVGLQRGARVALAVGYFSTSCATPPVQHPETQPLPQDIVSRAARTYYGVAGGERLSDAGLNARLRKPVAVCVGESHDNPVHHYVQLQVLRLLSSQASSNGESLASGFEMFQAPFQPALDAFASKKIDEQRLLEKTEYERRWGFDFSLYRPLLEVSTARGVRLLALNAPKEWTKAVAKTGVDALDPAIRDQLPDLVLSDEEHRSFFSAAMGGHPHAAADKTEATHAADSPTAHRPPKLDKKLERYYQAQVLWDEHMATIAANWLTTQPKPSRIVVFAGSGHCHRSAIPRRFERRTQTPMLSVRPIAERDLGLSPAPTDDAFDLLLVYKSDPISTPPSAKDRR